MAMSIIIKNIPNIPQETDEKRELNKVVQELEIEDNSFSYYEEDEGNFVFEPPVGQQRYSRVLDILLTPKWRKEIKIITDYGCGEYRLFKYIRSLLSIRKINFIDIDETVLKKRLPKLHCSSYHYLDRRFNPLTLTVFEGSISDPDERVLNSDAVIGIEIIEHLYPDTLEALPYVIFHSVKPKIVIFSTPNAEFNEVFPNFKKFRHPDHKFEWTREQFESWASNITLRFPWYEVSILGVGKHPDGIDSLGYCTQLALFVRRDMLDSSDKHIAHCYFEGSESCSCREKNPDRIHEKCWPMEPFGICSYFTKSKQFDGVGENDLHFYREIHTEEYLYCDDDIRTDEERLLEIMVRNMHYTASSFEGIYFVPLCKIICTQRDGQLISEKEAGDILTRNGFEVDERLMEYRSRWKLKPCVRFIVPKNSLYDESPSSESEGSEGF